MSGFSDRLLNRVKQATAEYLNPQPQQSTSLGNAPSQYPSPAFTPGAYVNAVYYPNWKAYSQPPSSLNLDYVTHIFYAFVWLKPDGSIYSSDEYADNEVEIGGVQGALADIRRVKQQRPHIKTVLSVGGGGEGSNNFAAVASNVRCVGQFVRSVKEFLDAHEMDGVDIDWEHPSDPSQGEAYVGLLSILRSALPAPRYLVISALPCGEWALQNINLAQAAQYLDFINLMCYDFSGSWTETAGHQAQLFSPRHPHSEDARISCDAAVGYVARQGVPASKVLLGIPAYGRSFLGATKPGHAYSGCAGEDGTFDYRELPRPGAKIVYDEACGATYCVGGDAGFVTYDDQRCVRAKAMFAKQRGLGGLFYWNGPGDTKDERSLIATGWRTFRE